MRLRVASVRRGCGSPGTVPDVRLASLAAPIRFRGPRRLRAVEDFGSDPSRVSARIYIYLRASVTTLLEGLSAGASSRLRAYHPSL